MVLKGAGARKAKLPRARGGQRVESGAVIAFAADVHVRSSEDERAGRFLKFLARPEISALFVLGDMFEFWFEKRGWVPGFYRGFLERLRGLGKRVYVLHGNRDFFLGRAFERTSGARVLGERVLLKLGKERVLLTHGDEFCRGDTSYRLWRMVSRSQTGRRVLKSGPETWCEPVVAAMMAASEADKRRKGKRAMAISLDAVELELTMGVDAVVCGHGHEAAEMDLAGGRLFRLGWWGGGSEVAVWDGEVSLASP